MAIPAPLTPEGCDCRGLPFMPLEVNRLLESDLVALSTGDEFKAALILWAKSWSQMPAASMPDDDRILARMTGYSLAEWASLRPMALRGWVRCSDGRLYHPVVADLAVIAYAKRRGQAERANSRWAKAKAGDHATADATASEFDATASPGCATADATAMQVKGTVEDITPPPPVGGGTGHGVTNQEVERCWALANSVSRGRSSKADLRRALEAAVSRGHAVDAIAAGLGGYFGSRDATADEGAHAKGVHRMVQNDRWQSHAPSVRDAGAMTEAEWQTAIRLWREFGDWLPRFGPKPGEPGCRAPSALILAEASAVAAGAPR